MNKMLIAVAGFVALLSGAHGARAFTTQPVSPETMSNRLADPDELADKMSNGQSGGATFGVPGRHMMLQFSAPPLAAPRTAHLLRARARYSCLANIGSGLGPQGSGRRRKVFAKQALLRQIGLAPQLESAQERQKPGESFTPRYEVS